jgi:hypothetical protein
MNRTQKTATILLGIWLILANAVGLLALDLPVPDTIVAILGALTGIALLVGWSPRRERTKGGRSTGLLLLGLWLVLNSLLPLAGVAAPAVDVLLTILALIAGILILLG